MITSINPATGAKIRSYELHSQQEVNAALDAAVVAQQAWRDVPITERVKLLTRLAEVLRAGKSEYAALITDEMGKPITEAEAEIEKCAVTCEFYAEAAPRFLADEPVASNATESAIVFDPLGIVLAIMPWNYPFWQLFRFAAPAFAAGNGAILKHANNVPGSALAIEDVMVKAGCPDGLFKTLLIDSRDVADIIADDRIAAVTLTGSTEVGSIVASQAGKALKKQVLELGGSDPFIVLEDADIDLAAEVAVKARYTNVGQSCVNAKRFIVVDSIADEFAEKFVANVKKLVVGDPTDRATTIGPMARANLRDDLHHQVKRSIEQGADLLLGGEPLEGEGFFYPPTVLDNVKPDQVAFCQETFGPVSAIIRASSEDEAIALANRTEFGLGAAIWTRDIDKARRLARKIDAGAVFINGMVASDARIPFGGIKKSGYGRELGSYGIKEFVNIKTLWVGPVKAS